jgi:hypothetical protein
MILATLLIEQKNISPDEWERAKIEASKKKVIELEIQNTLYIVAKNAIKNGFDNTTIAKLTNLAIEEIQELRAENK